jgi:hypothetical protein
VDLRPGKGAVVFKVYCHRHQSDVLLDTSRIESLHNTPDGPIVDWQCWCGARGSLDAGGRSRPLDGPVAAA